MPDYSTKPALCFTFACITSLTAAAPLTAREQVDLESRKNMVFVTPTRHATFAFLNKRQVSGLDVELAQWMTADQRFKTQFKTAPLEQTVEILPSGEADAMTSLFDSDRRNTGFDFSQPTKIVPVGLYGRIDLINQYTSRP